MCQSLQIMLCHRGTPKNNSVANVLLGTMRIILNGEREMTEMDDLYLQRNSMNAQIPVSSRNEA